MKREFDEYFHPIDDNEVTWIAPDGSRRLVAAMSFKGKKTKRNVVAHEQSTLPTVPVEQVIAHVNELLDSLKDDNDGNDMTEIELDGISHTIIGNCIVVKGCQWQKPVWKGPYDKKYDVIKELFGLKNVWDIVWLKFSMYPNTSERYLGVVALGNDINFSYTLSSGELVADVGQEWDESFVCIFPLTSEILKYRNRKEIETGVGNYLIKKKVPIIDFYSHNNYE